MDQAELLTIIGGLYDKLVADVADRVQARLQEGNALDAWLTNSLVLEDQIDNRIQSFVDTQLDLDDAVRQALDNIALDDMIVETVRDMDFTVSVSR